MSGPQTPRHSRRWDQTKTGPERSYQPMGTCPKKEKVKHISEVHSSLLMPLLLLQANFKPLLKHLFWSSNHNLPSIRRDLQAVPINPLLWQQLLQLKTQFEEMKKGNQQTDSFCLFPSGRAPNFQKYDGTGNPKAHLQSFCMPHFRDDNPLLIRLFQKSLEGPALNWFTSLAPGSVSTFGEPNSCSSFAIT